MTGFSCRGSSGEVLVCVSLPFTERESRLVTATLGEMQKARPPGSGAASGPQKAYLQQAVLVTFIKIEH